MGPCTHTTRTCVVEDKACELLVCMHALSGVGLHELREGDWEAAVQNGHSGTAWRTAWAMHWLLLSHTSIRLPAQCDPRLWIEALCEQ